MLEQPIAYVCRTLGEVADIDKYSRRIVKVTPQHNDECKKLLHLMGIPYIDVFVCTPLYHGPLQSIADYLPPNCLYVQAPCEAEAQCAALARAGKAGFFLKKYYSMRLLHCLHC
jgi:flap endonuclease-1